MKYGGERGKEREDYVNNGFSTRALYIRASKAIANALLANYALEDATDSQTENVQISVALVRHSLPDRYFQHVGITWNTCESIVQNSMVQYSMVQYCKAKYSTVNYSTLYHTTAQHSTAQH